MNWYDFFNNILNTKDYKDYKEFNIKYDIVPKNHMDVQLTTVCNNDCSCCVVRKRKEYKFNYIKFYDFFDRYLKSIQNEVDIYDITFTGGEITLLKPTEILDCIYNCIKIANKYNIKLNFNIITNLLKIKKEHLLLFKTINEISVTKNIPHLLISIDRFHNNTDEKRNKVYKNLIQVVKLGYKISIIKLIGDPILDSEYEFKSKMIHNLRTYIRDIDVETTYKTWNKVKHLKPYNVGVLIYGTNNDISVCVFPPELPFKKYRVHSKDIYKHDDLYNHNFFKILSYIGYKIIVENNIPKHQSCTMMEFYKKYRIKNIG